MPTQAGEALLGTLTPAFDSIQAQLAALGAMRDRPAGSVRITASEHAAITVLWPALHRLLPTYPDINVELSIDSSLVDIVSGRFDAGVRLGEAVARDMVARSGSGSTASWRSTTRRWWRVRPKPASGWPS